MSVLLNRLIVGQAVSTFGSQFTLIGLPLIAGALLGATGKEMGLLIATTTLPQLLFGPIFGVLADRHDRYAILLWCDLFRVLVILSVPLLYLMNTLGIVSIIIISLIMHSFTALFNVSYWPLISELVQSEDQTRAMSRVQTANSIAEAAGSGAVGLLFSLAPLQLLIAIDGLSFLVSWGLLQFVPRTARAERNSKRTQEKSRIGSEKKSGLFADLLEGCRIVWRQKILRTTVIAATIWYLLHGALLSLFYLFMIHDVGVSDGSIGYVFTANSLGMLAGSLIAPKIEPLLSMKAKMAGSFGVLGGCWFVAIWGGLHFQSWFLPAIAFVFYGAALVVAMIATMKLRLMIVPTELLSRVTSVNMWFTTGSMPVGAVLGGVIADRMGVPTAMYVLSLGMTIPPACFFFGLSRKNLAVLKIATAS